MVKYEGQTIGFGKHKDLLWTRVPVSYLHWIVNHQTFNKSDAREIAAAELKRRGTKTPNVDVSGHAIDRASLKLRKTWHQSRGDNEGLYSWLCRKCEEALEQGRRDGESVIFEGMKFVFEQGVDYPVLKTVMPLKNQEVQQ